MCFVMFFFFSSRRRHTRLQGDWSSDVCSSDLIAESPMEVDPFWLELAGQGVLGEETAVAVGIAGLASEVDEGRARIIDRKSTRLNSSHLVISYAVFCLKKKKITSRSADRPATP